MDGASPSSDSDIFLLKDREDLNRLYQSLQKTWTARRLSPSMIHRIFYDTFDWRLYSSGIALANVTDDPVRCQWITTDSEKLIQSTPGEPPRFASDLHPGTLRERMESILEMRALIPFARVYTEGQTCEILNTDGKVVARLNIEDHTVAQPGQSPSNPLPTRVRIAPLRGYGKASEKLRGLLSLELGLEQAPDLVQEIASAAGKKAGDYSSKLDITLSRRAIAEEAVRLILKNLFDTLLANEDGTMKDIDTEFLHDFRVAVRRTRSALSQIKGVLPQAVVERFSPEFKWLGQITGATRDMDVYLLNFGHYLQDLPPDYQKDLMPLKDFLKTHQQKEQETMVRQLRTPGYRKLKEDWAAYLNLGWPDNQPGEKGGLRIIQVASERIWAVFKKTLKAGRNIGDESPPEELHRLRIICKKLRYLLEFFRSLYPDKEVSGSIKALKGLQDNLGTFNDLTVQVRALESFTQQMDREGDIPVRTFMAIGILVHILLEKQVGVRNEFKARFEAFANPSNQKLFEGLFRPIHEVTPQ